MEFNEETHKVILDSMDTREAQAYRAFLMDERQRHVKDIKDMQEKINWLMENDVHNPIYRFYISAINRHDEDLRDIDELLELVKAKFKI